MTRAPRSTDFLRTFLFTPANHSRRVAKVFSCGADAAILDLEDAVATAEKADARHMAVEALAQPRACLAYVRINAFDTEFCYRDLTTIVGPGLDGIILPKVETEAGLMAVDWLLRQLEREAGLTEGSVDLLPIVETGAGFAAFEKIAFAGSRVRRFAFGAGDFTLDIDCAWTRDETEIHYARSHMVIVSRAAGLAAPVDTVWIELDDQDGLEASARTARRLGFGGKLCIHPAQIPVIKSVFHPTQAEIAQARKVVDAFEKAEASGSAALQVDGMFIDYPIVYRAQRILEGVGE